jgi:hypothetical protein
VTRIIQRTRILPPQHLCAYIFSQHGAEDTVQRHGEYTGSHHRECYADDHQVILKFRKGLLLPTAPIAPSSNPTDRAMTDAPDANRSAAPADDDDEYMPDAPESETGGNTAAPFEDPSETIIVQPRALRARTMRQTEQTTAAPAEDLSDLSTAMLPRRTPRDRPARQAEQTTAASAMPPRRTLRAQTARQAEQTTAAPVEDLSDLSTTMLPRRTPRTRPARQTEQTTAASAEDSSTAIPPRRTLRTSAARQTEQTEQTNALPAGRTLRSRTVRQTEQTNALPALPAAARAQTRRAQAAQTERVPHLTQRQLREKESRRGGVIELPWVSAPKPYRAPSPTDSELAAAHTSSASLLGMPPVVFKQIAEYLLIYQQPEELKQKESHRRMAEVTKAHVLTVSSEKVVRKPTHKQVARNLNTASLTNFFLVCRHFRDVGLKVYYGRNTFKFSSDQNLHDWAAAIPSRRKFVRSIQLESHWEMGFFTMGGASRFHPESLSMVQDYGNVHTESSRMFPNLERLHLNIGVAAQWQHDAFQKTRGSIPPAIEDVWWKKVKEWANNLLDSLKRYRTVSHKVDVGYTLIFDGAFFAGKTDDSYRQRMKDFAWKVRGIDEDLPKRPTRKELLPALPGPLLPNTTAVVARAPMGAWSQKYVNNPSIDSGSSVSGVVVRLHNWPGIITELLSPERLAMAPAKRAMRDNWAAVMSDLLTSDVPAQWLEKKERAQQAALAKSACLKRSAMNQARSAVRASLIAVHAELKATIAKRTAVRTALVKAAALICAWSTVMSELVTSDLPARWLKAAEEKQCAAVAELACIERSAMRKAMTARRTLLPSIFPELKASVAERGAERVAERARRALWRSTVMSELKSSDLPAKFLEASTERAQWAAIATEVTSREHIAMRQAKTVRKALWPVVFAELRFQIVEIAKVNAALEEEAREEAVRVEAARARAVAQRQGAGAGLGQGMRRTLLKSKK